MLAVNYVWDSANPTGGESLLRYQDATSRAVMANYLPYVAYPES